MNIFFKIIAVCLFCVISNYGFCAEPRDTTANSSVESSPNLNAHSSEEIEEKTLEILKTILYSKRYIILVEDVFITKGLIQLRNKNRLFVVKGDSAFTDLPYIGRIESPNLSMQSPDIEFSQPYTDYRIEEGKRNKFSIYLTVSLVGERYDIKILVSKDFSATIIINSSARGSIKYLGNLKGIRREITE